ncbi:MAG TPA: MFS transporter [Candidatus Dormibacteraeota bacterium]|nr:MFS transporter [Candidatus Dormibacteraeota bacterium]
MVEAPPARMLGALRHRNYRLFLIGQIISTVGTWMQSVALPWLALELTHNGFLVGLALATQFLPVLVCGPFAGVIADRYPKRSILLATQSAFVVPPFILFALTQTHHVQYWMILVAALTTGTINALDVPTRQSFQVELVGKQDLMNAIALNSSVFNAAAVIGPSIAGLLIAAVGVPICFLLNSVSYLAAIAALLLMRDLPKVVQHHEAQPLLRGLSEGLAYTRREPIVGMLLIAVGTFSLFAMNRTTLMPLFADQVLRVGARGFGFLLASMGLGSLAGALTLAFNTSLGGNPKRQLWMAAIWVAALLEFSVSHVFVLSMAALFVAGYTQISFVATANNRIQTITPDRLRGRVMAIYAQALIGVGPVGATQAGALASLFGAPWAMGIGATIAGAVILAIRLFAPDVFGGQPRKTSSTAATASAGTSHRSART